MCDICHMLGVTDVACQASRHPDAMLIVGPDRKGGRPARYESYAPAHFFTEALTGDAIPSGLRQTDKKYPDNVFHIVGYSCLKESIGSTFEARRAGTKLAKRTTEARRIDTLASVDTSNGLTP
ncbi:MAG: hypothetical protein QOJ51_3297 [Acidobacteriaceae bacterium]|jgi:hypothetical protein|nr:hypothetical protein [Acidobacteriaceae bacterium]